MYGRNVIAILEGNVDVPAEVGGHFGALFPDDRNSIPAIGSKEKTSLEDHVIPWSSTILSF